MTDIYSSASINGLELRNRFVRSATWEGMAADDGAATPQLNRLMADLAAGGVGLIITGHAYVAPGGQAGPWQLGAWHDDQIDGLRQMAHGVHGAGGAIMLQIAHAGGHAATQLTGMTAKGPSAFEGRSGSTCAAMTAGEIEQVVASLVRAARRARLAGFDGVQVHAAHGYLLSQFLSPVTNQRVDAYGGSLENRCRLTLKVVRRIRQAEGDDFPILIKLNSEDFIAGGWSVDEMLELAVSLKQAGIDGVELSGGTIVNPAKTHCARKVHPRKPGQEAYYRVAARKFKQKVDLPLLLVGGIRSPAVCGEILDTGLADFINLSRPLIAEPDLVRRWSSGDQRPSVCISCNRCYEPILAGKGIGCPVLEEQSSSSP